MVWERLMQGKGLFVLVVGGKAFGAWVLLVIDIMCWVGVGMQVLW